jgi:glutamate dehydrogenase (NADP+)
MELKNELRGRISEYVEKYQTFISLENDHGRVNVISITLCNSEREAKTLLTNGCVFVWLKGLIPTMPDAVIVFKKAKLLFAPGKAANAGGVATSGLEMSQIRLSWTSEG